MGNYRPITDTWILARPKVKYYGAFPSGFLQRGRQLLGVGAHGAVLHVCGGKVRDYPFSGFGAHDRTLDLDPECKPDFLRDARDPFPTEWMEVNEQGHIIVTPWDAVLIDRPYTEEDACHYLPGPDKLPSANLLLKNGIAVVPVGGKVGLLDYVWPQPPKNAKEVAVVTVAMGRNNRARYFTVFERLS